MIIAAMIAYYVAACGLVALVGYLAYRRNVHELEAATRQAITELRAVTGNEGIGVTRAKRRTRPRYSPPPDRTGILPPPIEVVGLERQEGPTAS